MSHAMNNCEDPSINDEFVCRLVIQVSKGAKIRNRYNQVPHLTQDTNGKVTMHRVKFGKYGFKE